MAKGDKDNGTAAAELTKEAVAKLPLKKRIEERVIVLDAAGKERPVWREKLIDPQIVVPWLDTKGFPVMDEDKDTGRRWYRTQTVGVSADVIHGFRAAGDKVFVTTVDGQKLEAALA